MKILSLPKHENLRTSKNIVEKEQFLLFSQYFRYISNFKSPITYKFEKCGCSNYFFLNYENLIYRGTDIWKCFRESLGIRDNGSWMYSKLNEAVSQRGVKISILKYGKYIDIFAEKNV